MLFLAKTTVCSLNLNSTPNNVALKVCGICEQRMCSVLDDLDLEECHCSPYWIFVDTGAY